MLKRQKKDKKRGRKKMLDCLKCNTQADCCNFGAWADLEEARVIAALGLKGEFFQLEVDHDFPSGFRIGTSYDEERCTFLEADGLCSIHKVDYNLKPQSCKEFPYENNKISPFAKQLCTLYKSKMRKGEG